MKWAEIRIQSPPESKEAVTAQLLAIGCMGVSEGAGRSEILAGHLPAVEGIQRKLESLRQNLSRFGEFGLPKVGEITLRYVEDKDWAAEWKKHFRPIEVGERLVIKPSWESYPSDSGRVIVELDPGMAFGTGGHPSTRLSLIAMERHVKSGDIVADIGTGSGILALAAAKLGAAKVHATDIDSLPRKIARENVAKADLESVITIHDMDAFDRDAQSCDVVVANIIADTVIELTPTVFTRLKTGGVFISAGIVEERLPDVMRCLSHSGFHHVETLEDDIWRCVTSKRRP